LVTSPDDEAGSRDGVPLRGVQLEPGWELGPDGVYFRRGARVILIDPDDRVLMVRGHDVDEPGRSWWFTVGGGIDPGESARQAARRELFEETGLRIVEAALVGPVIRRSAVFDFLRQHVRQDEEFFLARIDDPGELNRDGWTDTERDFVDEVRWWDLDELGRVPEEVFPHGFVDLVRPLLAGWDGTVRHLADAP
jgi:ADP-ribose pyrophosphatase YjhB (NUDIX family)